MAHPNHRRVAVGMFSVAVFVLAAKLIGAAKEMAVAWRFGVSSTLDAYLLAFTLVTWLPTILFSVVSVVLVPRLVALAYEREERSRFVAELNGLMLLLGLLLVMLIVVVGPGLVGLIAGAWDSTAQDLVQGFTRQMAPIALLMTISAFLSVRLQAAERQGYTFLEAMPALGIMVFVLLAPPQMGPASLVWGTLAGAALQVALLVQMFRHTNGHLGGISFSRRSPYWQSIYSAFGVMIVGQVVIGLATPIDQIFGARLGEGAIATLGYANRLIALASGLGATAIGRAMLPVLSEAVAKGELELGRAQAFKWTRLMLFAGLATASIGWILAPTIVALLFEHGAFTPKDTEAVAQVLRFGLLQLPFYFSGIVLVQWIAARNKLGFLSMLAFADIGIKIVAAVLLIPFFGIGAIPLSTTAMYLTSMCGCVYIARRVL